MFETLRKTQIIPYENQDPGSFGPAEELSINNGGRFALTKVLKLRSKSQNEKKIKIRELVPL
jgi:hypothetical protein